MGADKTAYVLDASALLALMLGEPGHERVMARLAEAYVHTVNVAEVAHKLAREGVAAAEAVGMIEDLGLEIREGVSMEQASAVGGLLAGSRDLGLSLGDCVCLVSGMWTGSVAVTADRRWAELDGRVGERGPFRVETIR